jgi:molybdopterin converting factor small subunit
MTIRLEFYGIVRSRAGRAALDVSARTLREALQQAVAQCPALEEVCTPDGRLRPGFLVNLNGCRFVCDEQTPLWDGDTVLLLSADVGG